MDERRRFTQWSRRNFGQVMHGLWPAWQRDSEKLKKAYRQRQDSMKPFGWSEKKWVAFRVEFGRMRICITHADGVDVLLPEIKARS